ncbi:fimbrial biogenesis chaperone [Cupriavidus agavae]|uniref:Chaperone protein EcpD n=1 Tax=Cupriavidus agavae TaxID=1001822 RepID=A0A4Q7S8Z5_9BURK|nr:molecular chaperone [Cupriavidus agavae]RZT42936.1 chaperone protein EcpD [Cupriavidus agavae]
MTALTAFVMAAGVSHAAIEVTGTRIVFDGDQKEQTVRLTNTAETPVLTQIWLDRDDPQGPGKVEAGAQDTPFILTPPVARLNSGKAQVVRIFKSADIATLPTDRESVFYFNVLEIPAKSKADESAPAVNRLNIALRTRLKLFYRPTGIQTDIVEAAEALKWHVRRDGADYVVTCDNPGALYVSFAKLALKQGEKQVDLGGGMAAPRGQTQFRFEKAAAAGSGPLSLDFDYITDLGAFVPGSVPLGAGG